MLLIAEIILTIIAWRKGWKARALLPMTIALGFGIIIGLALAASDGSIEDAMPLCAVIELVCFSGLIYMAARKPKSAQVAESHRIESAPAEVAEVVEH